MDYGLKGKNALVTGSTHGVGEATIRLLAEEGANVIVTGRKKERTEAIAAEIAEKYSVKAIPIPSDLAKKGEAERLFDESLKALGSLDILVNNAGTWPTAYVKDMELSEFDETVYINLEVPFLLCKCMVNHLLDRDVKGKIVNITSQAAFHGSTTGHSHYAAAKAGLVSFSISLAREVAKKGINVNLVSPGLVDTQMMKEALEDRRSYYEARVPLGRLANPLDVARPIVFLVSNQSDYLTGITLDATGGMLMR